MKVITEQLSVKTQGNCDIIDVTTQVRDILLATELKDGSITVFSIGSTASISTIEYEPGLKQDLPELLEKFIPSGKKYHHNDTWGDNNGHSHLRSTLFGCSQTFPFVNGEILLGTWQQVILIDFDERPRTRKIIVQIMGE